MARQTCNRGLRLSMCQSLMGRSAILHTYWIGSASSCFASGSEHHQECCRIETIHAKARGHRFHSATRPEHSPLACSSRQQQQLVSITKMWMIRCTQSCHFLAVLLCRPSCVCVHSRHVATHLCAHGREWACGPGAQRPLRVATAPNHKPFLHCGRCPILSRVTS